MKFLVQGNNILSWQGLNSVLTSRHTVTPDTLTIWPSSFTVGFVIFISCQPFSPCLPTTKNKGILILYCPSFRLSFHFHFLHFWSVVGAAHFLHQDCYKKKFKLQIIPNEECTKHCSYPPKKKNKTQKPKTTEQNKTKKYLYYTKTRCHRWWWIRHWCQKFDDFF